MVVGYPYTLDRRAKFNNCKHEAGVKESIQVCFCYDGNVLCFVFCLTITKYLTRNYRVGKTLQATTRKDKDHLSQKGILIQSSIHQQLHYYILSHLISDHTMASRIVPSAPLGGAGRAPGRYPNTGTTNAAPTSTSPITNATPARAKNVTPPPKRSSSAKRSQLPQSQSPFKASHPEMTVDKRIVDELLLICGVIGSTATTSTSTSTNEGDDNDTVNDNNREQEKDQEQPEFIPVTDCLNWLQDLQRALRRDSDTYRPIGLLLGQWRVVSQKLLPLVVNCSYDSALVLTICKILVILTKPLAEGARRAGGLVLDVKSGKVDDG